MTEILTPSPFHKITATDAAHLADRFATPLFVYDDKFFRSRCDEMLKVWNNTFAKSKVYWSYKTNYMPEVCRAAHEHGLGADFVSGFELEHARRMCPEGPFSFNGPLKRKSELLQAIEMGATINVDLLEEIDAIRTIVSQRPTLTPRLGIRVNPGVPLFDSHDTSFLEKHSDSISVSKFGWPISDGAARIAVEKVIDAGLTVSALHCHLSSQITNHEHFLAALRPVLDFASDLIGQGVELEEIDIGGGFGVKGLVRDKIGWWGQLRERMGEPLPQEESQAFDMPSFATSLKTELSERGLEDLTISCEPGRYLVSDAMALLTRVVGIKRLEGKTWLVVDGGLNILPTASFGERRGLRFFNHEGEFPPSDYTEKCSIGGPLCYEGDVIMPSAMMPATIAAGDLVMISDAGAYTVSRSTNFNQLRAAAVSFDGSDTQTVWRRENYADVFCFARQHDNT
ncbi:hypothetical protein [Sulfitobacter sp. NAS-14.1]|uniref:diaminopimelate decarboxylase family protein n=1 Tax=Sulfitobacter TaxID=60136 RepID=UPI000564C3D3|nr:hypothetical protein [Sulfitobacter sp. NAS-14.1]